MIKAIIDIGSNTIRLSVYKIIDNKITNLFNEKRTASLAAYIDDKGLMGDDGIHKLISVLLEFKNIISNFDDISKTYIIATASIRNAKNSEDIVKAAKKYADIDIQIISGEHEARLAFIGSSKYLGNHRGILTDIGGGSSEIVLFENANVSKSVSINIGSLNSYKKYVTKLFPSESEKKQINKALKNELKEKNVKQYKENNLYAVGGSARAALQMYNSYYKKDDSNLKMDVTDLKKLLKHIMDLNFSDKLNLILKVKADRVHTLLPGLILLLKIANYFSAKTIYISLSGIREGFIIEKITRKDNNE